MRVFLLVVLALQTVTPQARHRARHPGSQEALVATPAPTPKPTPAFSSAQARDQIEVVPQSDWWYKAYVATLLIALVSLGTLVAIWKQLADMKEARAEAVWEMKSAGSHTQELIDQARDEAAALANAMVAAKASADSIVNSERAWILLDMNLIGNIVRQTTPGSETASMHLSFRCRNVGKSPAWITDKCYVFEIYDPASPPTVRDIENLGRFEYGPELLAAGEESTRDQLWQTPGLPGNGKLTLVLGVVKYLDIFGQKRMTVCGYVLSPDEKKLERIAGPDYNQYV